MIANIDLKTLLEQYDKTESLVDELSNDLEQLERYLNDFLNLFF